MAWFTIFILIAIAWFAWNAIATKEIAIRRAKQLCEQAGVLFLDDTAALQKLRLRRQPSGALTFYRRYGFEFCTDHLHRYSGYIDLVGRYIQKTHMDVYRLPDDVIH